MLMHGTEEVWDMKHVFMQNKRKLGTRAEVGRPQIQAFLLPFETSSNGS